MILQVTSCLCHIHFLFTLFRGSRVISKQEAFHLSFSSLRSGRSFPKVTHTQTLGARLMAISFSLRGQQMTNPKQHRTYLPLFDLQAKYRTQTQLLRSDEPAKDVRLTVRSERPDVGSQHTWRGDISTLCDATRSQEAIKHNTL